MATQRDILRAVEGLPPAVLEEVKNFIGLLKKGEKGSRRPALSAEALARKQVVSIKKWAGANLGQGFSGRNHDEVLYGTGR